MNATNSILRWIKSSKSKLQHASYPGGNQYDYSAGIKRNQELQTENELSAGRLFAMQHSKEDVRGDIQVMRRAAEKADSELTQAEFDKQRQDMLVNRHGL